MLIRIYKFGKSLLLPGGVLLLGVMALELSGWPPLPPAALSFLFYSGLLGGILLAWRFHSSRTLTCLAVLFLAQQTVATLMGGHPPSSSAELTTLKALALFVPLNYAFVSLTKERGLTISSLSPIALLLFIECVVVFVLSHTLETLPAAHTHGRRLASDMALPTWTILIFAATLVLLLIRHWLSRKPIDAALLWSLVAFFVYLRMGPSHSSTFYLIAAVYIPVVSIIENSYLLAYHDELTTLPSRRAFNEAMLRLREPYTIAVVDIDHFKGFNDTYGHETGDEVLRMVAARLAAVTGGGQSYRCGGEEFTILFPGKTTADVIQHLENLRCVVESSEFRPRGGGERRQTPRGPDRREPKTATVAKNIKKKASVISQATQSASGKPLSVTVSMGVATAQTSPSYPDQVLEKADKALYRAKENGRNRIETASPKRRARQATAGIA